MTHIDYFLANYGYFAIFGLLMLGIVGPLIPDETILVLAGVFVHRGQLHFVPAALVGIAGSMCGITLSYALGRYGYAWLDRHFEKVHRLTVEPLRKAEHWFQRFGKWALFFGYFVAGARHFTALFAGVSGMAYKAFAFPAYAGAVGWVLTFVGIGYFIGEQWSQYARAFDGLILAIVVVIAVASVVAWIMRKKLSRRA